MHAAGNSHDRLVSALCAVRDFNLPGIVRRGQPGVSGVFLYPGDTLCNLMGVPQDSDHRMILRSFFNMLIWGAVGTVAILAIMR